MGRDDDDEVNQPVGAADEVEEELEPPAQGGKRSRRRRQRESQTEGLDTVKSYLRDIRKSTLLTFEQEQALGKRVMAGDVSARDQMIEANLRLVISIGKRYMNRGFP